MADEWIEEPFPEVIDFQEGPGILAKDFRDEGVPLVRLSGLNRGRSVLSGCNYLDREMVAGKWAHFALAKGDILLSTSASLGRIAVVDEDAVGAIPYTGIIRMRPRDGRLVAPFIRYLLEGPDFQRQAEMVGVGSVIRHFGPMHLRQMNVKLPPPDEQRAIAHILGTLDDRIELNRRMNETLEAMARALFKSWFVDFDPVRAKAEGRDPSLPQPLADRFPSRFVDSELGEIPEGWLVRTIESVCNMVTRGVTPKYEEGSRRYVINQRVNRGTHLELTELKELASTLDVPTYCYAKRWDVLINCLGEGTLGRVHLFKGTSDEYAVDQHMSICRGATPGAGAYIYQLLASPTGQEKIESLKTGSTGMTMFNISKLRGFEFLWPGDALVAEYFRIAQGELERAATSEAESHALAAIRDTLLPKLISGELRLDDSARFLGGVD